MPAIDGSAPMVLLAETDTEARAALVQLLEDDGCRTVALEDPQTVVTAANEQRPDLIILSATAADPDLCRLVKASEPTLGFTPVILLTDRENVDARIAALRSGADDCIARPYDGRELLARVGNLVRIRQMHLEVQRAKEKLERLSIRDELTQLYNYRYLQERLTEEFKRAERYREPLSCLLLDLDHFKSFNDQFGPELGDRVLAATGERLRNAVREVDVVARYGGEEFLLLLPSTQLTGALTVAERVWRAVSEAPFRLPEGRRENVEASVGVSVFPSRTVRNRDDLLKAAVRALRRAKAEGRNCICISSEPVHILRPS